MEASRSRSDAYLMPLLTLQYGILQCPDSLPQTCYSVSISEHKSRMRLGELSDHVSFAFPRGSTCRLRPHACRLFSQSPRFSRAGLRSVSNHCFVEAIFGGRSGLAASPILKNSPSTPSMDLKSQWKQWRQRAQQTKDGLRRYGARSQRTSITCARSISP